MTDTPQKPEKHTFCCLDTTALCGLKWCCTGSILIQCLLRCLLLPVNIGTPQNCTPLSSVLFWWEREILCGPIGSSWCPKEFSELNKTHNNDFDVTDNTLNLQNSSLQTFNNDFSKIRNIFTRSFNFLSTRTSKWSLFVNSENFFFKGAPPPRLLFPNIINNTI